MWSFLSDLFSTDGFVDRWSCGRWSDELGWLHIGSDAAIFGAYTAIPCVLAFFIIRRRDVPFPSILWLFVAFIFACGFGHLIEAIIFWQPVYRLSAGVKLATALVSWATVIALVQLMPQILRFPGLARLNTALQHEVLERKRVEAQLRSSQAELANLLNSAQSARDEAERANRVKDDFLSTVSHELRTPLHAILGYAQLLQLHPDEDQQHEGLSVIERNAKVQAKIIDDLLDMSRIVSGKVRLDIQTVDMGQIVDAAVATIRPAADAKQQRLQVILDSSHSPVLGDRERLHQVVWNLLTNAVKFTPKQGRIQISLHRVNSHVELHVSDTGEGIRADLLPYIFERFRQGETRPGRGQTGLGLGLSIVKHLVELHGGTVEARSPGTSQGATFVVRLPVQIVHGAPVTGGSDKAASASPGSIAVSLSGTRVLVVDDELDSRELVRRLLKERDAQVTTAASGGEALAALRAERFDVLLSDIDMPGMDGCALMRAVRTLPEADGGKIRAAAITALARTEDRTHAMLAGFQAFVAKPVDVGELIAVVAALAGRTGDSPTGRPASESN